MTDLNTVAVTTSSGDIHTWNNVMWAVASDDTLVIYGIDGDPNNPKSFKVAQFAKGAWDLVEIVNEEEDEEDESEVLFYEYKGPYEF